MNKFINNSALFIISCLVFSCGNGINVPKEVAAFDDKLPEKIDYNLHIKPILSDRCFKCHGPDKSKIEAGLQLTSAEGATKILKSGNQAIVPNNIAKSELVKRILSHDPDELMPLPKSNLSLTDEEKALLIKWIDQGAEYKEHWSLTKIVEPDVPKIGTFMSRLGISTNKETDWAKNEIDHFVIQKLNEQKLTFSKEADKLTLLRRVYLDLTGLPPSVSEVDAYLKDNSPNSYEKIVDNLLKSPHFGEKMAVDWLDLARYADTDGYQDDGYRNIYPYRDWVIKAFNNNLPYNQFVTWQLAGDLLPKPTNDMLVATAFNRNHQQTQEGGVVDEEYRVEYVADRVNTFGKAFLGLTTECARCHDHKYDPITQKDYYSLFAFFNNNNERGQIPYSGEACPTVILTSKKANEQINFIKNKLQLIDNQVIRERESYKLNFEKWLSKAVLNPKNIDVSKKDLVAFLPLDDAQSRTFRYPPPKNNGKKKSEKPKKIQNTQAFINVAVPTNDIKSQGHLGGDTDIETPVIEGKYGKARYLPGDVSIKMDSMGVFQRYDAFTVALWYKLDKLHEGPIFSRSHGRMNGVRGYECNVLSDGRIEFSLNHVYPDNGITVVSDEKVKANEWFHVAITYDGSSKASGAKMYLNGKQVGVKIMSDNLLKSTLWQNIKKRSNWGNDWAFRVGARDQDNNKEVATDEIMIYHRKLAALEILQIYNHQNVIEQVLMKPANKRTPAETASLFDYYLNNFDEKFIAKSLIIKGLVAKEDSVITDEPEVMTFHERRVPRNTFLLKRGAYDAPGEAVSARIPAKFGEMPKQFPRNRLGLAMWLTDENNPLFARVAVNRIWQQLFGNGIVKTQEDFGNQGNMPSHPELLDWLAVEFRKDNWDTKKIIKKIVMSATYQQSSVSSPQLTEIDPDNKFLARGPSYRLSAEQVRDLALAASGLLSRKIGGPSVKPYQPEGIWEALTTRNLTNYEQNHGDSLYRRSMYTFWKRSAPPPMMLNYDVPDRSLCTVRRQKTATPLQALVTLNDPQFVEAARVLAQNAGFSIQHSENPNALKSESLHLNLESSVVYAFKALIGRPPRLRELNLMKKLYDEELADFQKNPNRAMALISVGEAPCSNSLNTNELAAMTIVCNTLMNYDEAVMKR